MVLIFHFDEAPPFLKTMAYPPNAERQYMILVPTGINENLPLENRLNIVRATDILDRFGVKREHYAGQTTHCDGVHYRVFII